MKYFIQCENCNSKTELTQEAFEEICHYNDIEFIGGGFDENLPLIEEACCSTPKTKWIFE